jgi:hypothetical protein
MAETVDPGERINFNGFSAILVHDTYTSVNKAWIPANLAE